MNLVKKSLKYLASKEKLNLSFICFLIVLSSFFELFGIGLILPILNLIVDSDYYSNSKYFNNLSELFEIKNHTNLIYILIILIIFLNFVKSLILSFTLWYQNSVISLIHIRITTLIYKKYINSNWEFFLNKNSATILRNVHSNTHEFTSKILHNILLIFADLIILIFLVSFLMYVNFQITLIALIFFLIIGFIFQKITKKYNQKFGIVRQEFLKLVNKHLLESFRSFKLIKLNLAEKYFFNTYKYISTQEILSKMKQDIFQKFPKIWIEFIVLISVSIFLIFSISNSENVLNTIPLIGVFVLATFKILPSLNRIIFSLQALRFAAPALDNLDKDIDQIDKKKTIIQNNDEKFPIKFNKQIEIKSLSFGYEKSDKNLFNNFNFKIKKNEFIGILGESGSGKSTLIDILMGIIKPKIGNVLVDDVDIFNNLDNWFKNIGFVPQETYLLDDTIKNNIIFGSNKESIDEDYISEILKILELEGLVNERQAGQETLVGDNGVKLSGGQKQRIGLARALYKKPKVLILDEFTSSLDLITEEKILKELIKFKNKITIIFVTHRDAVVKYCDRTIHLNK